MYNDGKPCLFLLEKYKRGCLSIKCLKYQTMLLNFLLNHNKSNKHRFKILSRILQTPVKTIIIQKINFIIYLVIVLKQLMLYIIQYIGGPTKKDSLATTLQNI